MVFDLRNPVNKSISYIRRKINPSKGDSGIPYKNRSVTVVTCTNKEVFMKNIFKNYSRQSYKNKSLLIVLNNNRLNLKKWLSEANKYDNVTIYQIDENVSLGECLNFAVKSTSSEVIAKFDDDDYYGPRYLAETIKAFDYTNAHIIGKSTSYVYFQGSKTLAIRNPKRENTYVNRIEGPTMIIKREVFDRVSFQNKSLGEDVQFCKDCMKNGFKIFSTDRHNFVYIRHFSTSHHTWRIRDDFYMKLCSVIGVVDDYKKYADRKQMD